MAKKTTAPEVSKSEQARQYAAAHPKATTQEIATALGYTYTTVYQALKPKKKKSKKGRKQVAAASNGHPAKTATKLAAGNGSHKSALAAYVEWAGGIGRAIEILQVVQGAKVPF